MWQPAMKMFSHAINCQWGLNIIMLFCIWKLAMNSQLKINTIFKFLTYFNIVITATTWSNCTLWKPCPCIYVHVSFLIILYTHLCAWITCNHTIHTSMRTLHLWLFCQATYVHVSSLFKLMNKKNGITRLCGKLSNLVLLCTGSVHVSN